MKAFAVEMDCKVFGISSKYVLYLQLADNATVNDIRSTIRNLKTKGFINKGDNYAGRFLEVHQKDAQAVMGNQWYHLMNPATYFIDWQSAEASHTKLVNAPAETEKGRSNAQQSAKAAMSQVNKGFAEVGEKLPGPLGEAAKTINKFDSEVVAPVMDDAPQVIANVLEGVKSIISILGSIAKMLPVLSRNMELLLKAQEEAWKGMEPIYKHFNEEVVEPYRQLMGTEAGKVLEKLKKDILAGNLSSDTLTPDIHGPWSSPAMYAQLSLLFANPYAGPGNLAALNVMRQVRYEQGTGRGPATLWDVMARASTMGQPDAFTLAAANVPQMASDAGQMVAKIPEWWMSNIQTPPAADPKPIVPRPDAGQKRHEGKAWRPKPRRYWS